MVKNISERLYGYYSEQIPNKNGYATYAKAKMNLEILDKCTLKLLLMRLQMTL